MMENKKTKQTTIRVRRVVEYSDLFAGEKPIDIASTLRLFNRNALVRVAAILSLHFGNMCLPDNDNSLFSEISKMHIPYLNRLFKAYYKRIGLFEGQKVQILTYRTSLELWRQIFAIRVEEFTNEVAESDFELLVFKVILTINEKLVSFNEKEELYKLDELLFLNGFITNDNNNYDLQSVLQPQMYYFRQLVNFIPMNEVLSKASERLFNEWGIESWQPYYTTIVIIASETDKYYKKKENGVPIIRPQWLEENNDSGLLSSSLMEHLSIDEDEYIPFEDEDAARRELNVDYRRFRSKPFIKLKDGSGYVVINNQLLCERLFNSLYFDFLPLINNSKGSVGFFDYNKNFIEKILFRNTFYRCLPSNCYTFPVCSDDSLYEEDHEPDFYARTKRGELIIVECKGIKMNGENRDDGDYVRFLDELHEKIVLKTRNLDKTRKEFKGESEPIGVGQLIHHIDSIEADSFQWDRHVPDDVRYYPLLVFEDVKLVQKGILSMVNRWFIEEVEKEKELDLKDISCMPVMVISVNTLYLYDELLHKKGLTNVIDSFVRDYSEYDKHTGVYHLSETADFEEYLRKNPFHKADDAVKWTKEMINIRKNYVSN